MDNNTYDAIVIGAGFGGVYGTHKFANEMGFKTIAFEKGSGPAGTWHWNRYPGALSDTQSYIYRYSFDKELLEEGEWEQTYLTQPEIYKYFNKAVDKLNVRKYYKFNTEVTSARYIDDEQLWEVVAGGETYRARYLFNALGLLSAINWPNIPGLDTFAGDYYHTGAWPEGVDLTGRRVGVIGSGSTGTQVVTELADKVEHLTHFIRTPQYSVPLGKRTQSEEEIREIKDNYDEIWDQVMNSQVGFGFEESTIPAMSVSEEERERVFEEAWQKGGGFNFMFGTFSDIATDLEANEAAASFIRKKINTIVKDPEKARKLTPTEIYARRPLCDNGFYDKFNRENVDVVLLKETPIKEIVPEGIVTEDGTLHELDAIIFATGFDAVDGNYRRMEIIGRNGVDLNDEWADEPSAYLGTTVANFPNWYMILGPRGPFTNLPPSIETQVEWITDQIKWAEENNIAAIEPKRSAVDEWAKTCDDIAAATVFGQVPSWIFGANVEGKKPSVLFYMAGLGAYRNVIGEVAANGYPTFEKTPAHQTATS